MPQIFAQRSTSTSRETPLLLPAPPALIHRVSPISSAPSGDQASLLSLQPTLANTETNFTLLSLALMVKISCGPDPFDRLLTDLRLHEDESTQPYS